MKATEFCYWLQGLFELNERTKELESDNIKLKESLCSFGVKEWCVIK